MLVPLALCTASAASAQLTAGQSATVDRIGAEQIGPRTDMDTVSVQQVSTGPRTVPPGVQASRPADIGQQVGPVRDRSTVAPPSGSSRADGKPVAASAIGGSDQCDATAPDRSTVAACRNPIERRAAQYAAPQPTKLSPEQRLAIARAVGDGASASLEAGRLARTSDNQMLSAAEQGVASLVLAVPAAADPAQPADDVQVDPTVFDTIIDVIVNTGPTPK